MLRATLSASRRWLLRPAWRVLGSLLGPIAALAIRAFLFVARARLRRLHGGCTYACDSANHRQWCGLTRSTTTNPFNSYQPLIRINKETSLLRAQAGSGARGERIPPRAVVPPEPNATLEPPEARAARRARRPCLQLSAAAHAARRQGRAGARLQKRVPTHAPTVRRRCTAMGPSKSTTKTTPHTACPASLLAARPPSPSPGLSLASPAHAQPRRLSTAAPSCDVG